MLLVAFERTAAQRIEQTGGKSLIVYDVYPLLEYARRPGPALERVYVGDSVARQFFPAGAEPHDRVRFLTNNGGLSIAGNYYLVEDAFRNAPSARDAVLVIRPETLQVNLDPPWAADFFCGLFHSFRQVVEIFRAKRDLRLTASHAGRWVMPGTLAINAAWRQDPRSLVRPYEQLELAEIVPPAPPTDAVDAEPLLAWLNLLWGGARDFTPVLAARGKVTDVILSPIGAYYLDRMRALCESRGGRLRVLSVPYPADLQWNDVHQVFDAPIFYLPPEDFGDQVHVGPPNVWLPSQVGSPVARRLAETYGLLEDLAVSR